MFPDEDRNLVVLCGLRCPICHASVFLHRKMLPTKDRYLVARYEVVCRRAGCQNASQNRFFDRSREAVNAFSVYYHLSKQT